jgi:hypothetical protein
MKWVRRSFFYDTYSLKMLMSKFIFSILIKFYFLIYIAIPTLYRYMFRHSLSQSDETQILNKGFEIIKRSEPTCHDLLDRLYQH